MNGTIIIRETVRFLKRRRDRRSLLKAMLILLPIGVWFGLMQVYIAVAPVDEPLRSPDADSIVALPHGTTLLEPRGTAGRTIADWLATHPQGVRSFEVGGNQFLGETADLTDESVARIGRLAAMLKAAPDVSVTIVSRAKAEAREDLSGDLGMRRAQSVRLELIQFGIAGNRISVESRGVTDPAAAKGAAPSGRTIAPIALVLVHNDTSD